MNTKALVCTSAILGLFTLSTGAQVFENFETYANDQSSTMFNLPRTSGSTSGKLASTPNIGRTTSLFPSGNTSTKVFEAQFSYLSAPSDPWARLTTIGTVNGTTAHAAPTIDFKQNLGFDLYSD